MTREVIVFDKIGGAGARDLDTINENLQRLVDDGAVGAAVSGPGGEAGRVTEMALSAIEAFKRDEPTDDYFEEIGDRLVAHASPMGSWAVRIAHQTVDNMQQGLQDGRGFGWVGARPEHYQAELDVELLDQTGQQATLLDVSSCLVRDSRGSLGIDTADRITRTLSEVPPGAVIIIPGTPGVDASGAIVPITPELRGFTDTTGFMGAEAVRRLTGAPTIYRVIKDDVSGILRASPKYIDSPNAANRLSITEAEALTRGGSGVVHSSVLELLQDSEVRLLVSDGTSQGTVIERTRTPEASERITGIAVQEAMAYTVRNIKMEHMSGSTADILALFRDLKVPLIDVQTGVGVVTAYVNRKVFTQNGHNLSHAISERFPGTVSTQGVKQGDEFSIVALVGEALADQQNAAQVASEALQIGRDMALRGHWASPGRNAFYVLVGDHDVRNYVNRTYDRFFGKNA